MRATYTCTCGRTFDKPHQLANHIGYAILLDDNKDKHQVVETHEDYGEDVGGT